VALHDPLDDGEAEAGAAVAVGVGAVEGVEDGGVLTVRDADAVVGDLDLDQTVAVLAGADLDLGGDPRGDVLDRVPDQVVDDLPQQHRLRDHIGKLSDRDDRRHLAAGHRLGAGPGDVVDDGAEVDGTGLIWRSRAVV